MNQSLTVYVRNAIDAIPSASETAEAWLAERQASPDAFLLTSLAIEEIVTNCIKYGYDDDGAHTIVLTLSVADQVLTMTVVDDGRAFNPLERARPDLSLAIEDRPIGGLGIHLLRELADDLTYERRDGTNRLTLVKRLRTAEDSRDNGRDPR